METTMFAKILTGRLSYCLWRNVMSPLSVPQHRNFTFLINASSSLSRLCEHKFLTNNISFLSSYARSRLTQSETHFILDLIRREREGFLNPHINESSLTSSPYGESLMRAESAQKFQHITHSLATISFKDSSAHQLAGIVLSQLPRFIHHYNIDDLLRVCDDVSLMLMSRYGLPVNSNDDDIMCQLVHLVVDQIVSHQTSHHQQTSHLTSHHQHTPQLTSHQLVHISFYLIAYPVHTRHGILKWLEGSMVNLMRSLTSVQISVVCYSMFKSWYRPESDSLLIEIVDRVCADIQLLPAPSMSNMLKFIKWCADKKLGSERHMLQQILFKLITVVGHRFAEDVNNYSTSQLLATHLATAILSKRMYDGRLLSALHHRLLTALDHPYHQRPRLKDMARTVRTLSTLNYPAGNRFYHRVAFEVRKGSRREECFTYPAAFIELMVSLVYVSCYDYDLLQVCLSKEMWQAVLDVYDERDMSLITNCRDWLQLIYEGIRVERPDFHFPLPDIIYTYRGGDYQPPRQIPLSNYLESFERSEQKPTRRSHLLNVAARHLDGFHGFVGPAINTSNVDDIVIYSGKEEDPPPSPTLLHNSNQLPTNPQKLPDSSNSWHVLLFLHHESYCQQSFILLGFVEWKIRQLQRLGYHVILINELFLRLSQTEQAHFLAREIFGKDFGIKKSDQQLKWSCLASVNSNPRHFP